MTPLVFLTNSAYKTDYRYSCSLTVNSRQPSGLPAVGLQLIMQLSPNRPHCALSTWIRQSPLRSGP